MHTHRQTHKYIKRPKLKKEKKFVPYQISKINLGYKNVLIRENRRHTIETEREEQEEKVRTNPYLESTTKKGVLY